MFGKVQSFSSIVQYVAMQQETNNNNRKTSIGPVRCLFGIPDQTETKFLVEDELKKQEESFFDRWDFEDMCVETSSKKRKADNENEENEIERSSKRIMLEETLFCFKDLPVPNPRRILQPRNGPQQSHITDFWFTKKSHCEDRPRKLPTKYSSQHLNI